MFGKKNKADIFSLLKMVNFIRSHAFRNDHANNFGTLFQELKKCPS